MGRPDGVPAVVSAGVNRPMFAGSRSESGRLDAGWLVDARGGVYWETWPSQEEIEGRVRVGWFECGEREGELTPSTTWSKRSLELLVGRIRPVS